MRRKTWRPWVVAITLTVGGLTAPAAQAGEMDILLDKLVQKGILTTTDAAQIRQEVVAEKKDQDATATASKEIAAAPASNWKWSGDLRLREEYRNRTGSGQDINRQRIRFRYGFETKINDQLKAGARLATGSTTDPISTNQTLNTSFNKVNCLLDRAYVEYSPSLPLFNEAKLTGGIIANPFWTVGQLVWDDDLNFDGAAVHLATAAGPVTLFTNDGVFSLQTDVSEAAALWSAQAGVIYKPFADAQAEALQHLKVTGALAYHDYKNVTRTDGKNTALATAGGSKGNNASLKDVNLFNPTIEVASQYAEVPFSLFGDWVHNAGASVSNNGFQIGLRINKAVTPWDLKKGWEGGYYFERLDPDATLGAFTDSDFSNGGTNHRGNIYWVKLAVLKNSTLGVKYFNARQVHGAKTKADTLQMDWITSF